MATFACLCVFDSAVGVRWFSGYLRSLEGERYAIGKFVAANTRADQVLLSGHGLLSAWTPARVVDYSGLNSKVPLQYGGDWAAMAKALRPDAIIVGGYDYYLEPLRGLPYRIEETFYEIADQGAPPWHFIQMADPLDAFSISYLGDADFSGIESVTSSPTAFSAGGTSLTWVARERDVAPRALRLGVQRPLLAPAALDVQISWEGVGIERRTITIPAAEARLERTLNWQSVVLSLDPQYSGRIGYQVTLKFAEGNSLRLYAPILTNH
jgi:hypothetical protein